MSELLSDVIDKLDEYGVTINSKYEGDNNEHVLIVDNMILMIDKLNDEISVSFFAGTRPDDSANAVLILAKIPKMKRLHVMESYALLDNKQIIQGDEAYEFLRKTITNEAVKKHALENIYTEILTNTTDCPEC